MTKDTNATGGAAYAALPDADRDYMRKVVAVAVTMLFDGYKEDVTRVFSTGELSEFATITAAMGGERVEDIYRRAWDLLSLPVRASHGQAPAQAAPAAVAWRELCRRLYVELFHCDKQMTSGKRPKWQQGKTVRDVLADTKAALDSAPQPATTTQADSQPAPMPDWLPFSKRMQIADRHGVKVTAEFNALVRDVIQTYLETHADRAARAQADSVLEDAARWTTEQEHAIRQGHEIAASDGYFDARPQIDSNDRRKVFQAGFERGWDAASKQGANHD